MQRCQTQLAERIHSGFIGYQQSLTKQNTFNEIFAAFQHFALLIAVRKGYSGLETINRLAQKTLGFPEDRHRYHGRLVMVTSSNYQTRLINGNVGLCLDLEGSGNLRTYFPHRMAAEQSYWAVYPIMKPPSP